MSLVRIDLNRASISHGDAEKWNMSLPDLKNISQVSPVNKLVINIFQHVESNDFLYLQEAMYCCIFYVNTNEIPNYFTLQ